MRAASFGSFSFPEKKMNIRPNGSGKSVPFPRYPPKLLSSKKPPGGVKCFCTKLSCYSLPKEDIHERAQ
jgi:hypothetical protein